MRKESESRGGQEEEDEREEFYLFRAFLGRRERERERDWIERLWSGERDAAGEDNGGFG